MFDPSPTGSQLIRTPESALPAASTWTPPANLWLDSQQEESGFSFRKFLHSLRRTWLFGLLAGLVASCTLAGVLWLLVPDSYEAFALLRVKLAEKEMLETRNLTMNAQEFSVYKETQRGLVKSPFVIRKAIRPDEIRQLSILQNLGETPEKYLERELDISFPDRAELMRVALRGSQPEELKKVVNAVVDSYLLEIRTAGNTERAVNLQKLRQQYEGNLRKIQEQEEEVHQLSVEVGAGESTNLEARRTIAMDDLRSIARQRDELIRGMQQLQSEVVVLSRARQLSQIKASPHMIQDQLEGDPTYMEIKRTIKQLEMEARMNQSAARSGSATQMRTQMAMDELTKELKAREVELIPRIKARISSQLYGFDENVQNTELRTKQLELSVAQERLKVVQQQYRDQVEAFEHLESFNAVLVTKLHELESLKESNTEIAKQIGRDELSLQTPSRVISLHRADVPQDADKIVRLLAIFAASLATFGFTFFGIAYVDYARNVMSTANELERETNLAVLGKLPATSGRTGRLFAGAKLDGTLILDAVDTVRAAITRGDKAQDVDSVLVTSAVGKEGKTTLASQLAVSFSRSGKRTVLVDGDIRSPHQHLLFGASADCGLCELLRGDTSLAEAVQATPADNLWILSAGRYDTTSLLGLSGSAVGEILAQLRSEYDFVIVDSGPVLTGPEAMIFGQYVSGAVLASRQDFSSLEKVDEANRRLRSVGIRIMGAVINGAAAETRKIQLALPTT